MQDDADDPDLRLDTVGCVGIDSAGNACAAVSSGGLLLKLPGRIGEVACDTVRNTRWV
jgi:isoaspartyl peptidase/L-asparaginase-like protein (Ntn-hydrolase superfamily)